MWSRVPGDEEDDYSSSVPLNEEEREDLDFCAMFDSMLTEARQARLGEQGQALDIQVSHVQLSEALNEPTNSGEYPRSRGCTAHRHGVVYDTVEGFVER